MKYRICCNIYITSDHPSCSYGQPVVLIDGEPHGPMDLYAGAEVWELVYFWELQPDHLEGEQFEPCAGESLVLAHKFLRLADCMKRATVSA